LFLGDLILDDILVFLDYAVPDAHDVDHNNRRAVGVGITPMRYDVITLRHDYAMLVFGVGRESFHEIEEAISPGSDVGTVLNAVWRPVPLGGVEVTLIEQNIKPSSKKGLYSFRAVFPACHSPFFMRVSAIRPG
jgi:hypothetical protein